MNQSIFYFRFTDRTDFRIILARFEFLAAMQLVEWKVKVKGEITTW